MKAPLFKVTITHDGSDIDYEKTTFSQIRVKRSENNFSTATLVGNNYESRLYPDAIDDFDIIKIYVKDYDDASYTQIFGGTIRQVNPSKTELGLVQILAKGFGAAADVTHCSSDYGKESSNTAKDTPKEIWDDIIDNYVNKSFGGLNTGYALTKTYIANIRSSLSITHLNNPYRKCSDVINRVCQVVCADLSGSAGPHWFVDPSKNLFINTIGNHENSAQWPNFWGGSESASTLVEDKDFNSFTVWKKTEEFANKIVFITDFRRPSYDFWTNNQSGLWGTADGMTVADEAAIKLVGSHSLKLTTTGAQVGKAYFPSGQAAGWDVTKWGSEKTIPHLSFYMRKDENVSEVSTAVCLFTTAYLTDYFYIMFSTWTEPDNEWIHKSIPIGPYWETAEESRRFRWGSNGSPNWANINGITFYVQGGASDGNFYVDDLHFVGKLIREAYNQTNINSKCEYQAIAISKTAMDDSCVAADDSGIAARYAYAELLRRQKIPLTFQCTVSMKKDFLPGQKFHVHACKDSSGNFKVDTNFRAVQIIHDLSAAGFLTTLIGTDDLTNSFPLTGVDQYKLMTEYLLVNNTEAMDIRSTDVDLLIERLSKNYPS